MEMIAKGVSIRAACRELGIARDLPPINVPDDVTP